MSKLKLDNSVYPGQFLQVANLKFDVDLTKPIMSRISNLMIKDEEQSKLVHLPDTTDVIVLTNSYIGSGKNGFQDLKKDFRQYQPGPLDADVMEAYVAKRSPITLQTDSRINMLQFQNAGRRESWSSMILIISFIFSVMTS